MVDGYTKGVLTVIAVALTWLALRRLICTDFAIACLVAWDTGPFSPP